MSSTSADNRDGLPNQHKITSGFGKIKRKRENYATDWLQSLKDEDDIYPYWRIHNKLYDLTEYMDKHPGGKFWIKSTQGLDITESFESSHFTENPRQILKKYFVTDIVKPRTSPFTFEEDGFFRTLKRKADPIIRKVKSGPTFTMLFIQDSLFASFLATTIWACMVQSHCVIFLAGFFLTLAANCAHNFFHQKNNLRMYITDFTLLSSKDLRISHVFLHHNFPNTVHDYDSHVYEPMFKFYPTEEKNFFQRYIGWTPLGVLPCIGFHISYIRRTILYCTGKVEFSRLHLIQPFLLLSMSILANSFTVGFSLWFILHLSTNLFLFLIGGTMGHHHEETYFEGDSYIKEKDWGLLQIVATAERKTVNTSLFLTATSYGNHTMHHLFPTIDHSKLPYLVEPFLETCKEFGIDFILYSEWETFKGFLWRIANTHPNHRIFKKFKNYVSKYTTSID